MTLTFNEIEKLVANIRESDAGSVEHDSEVSEVMSELSEDFYPGMRMIVADYSGVK